MTTEPKIRWTDQQSQAIGARGANVFVAASAGTGKTAVLSGRCVDLVSDEAVCPDVLSMLVLTFTEAAAEQMRSRIARQLRETFRQTRDGRLARQMVLLQGADISTIHAFCKRLITEHFHEIALDPSFRIIDSDEAMLLQTEVLEQTIEWAWQQEPLDTSLKELLRRRDLRATDGFLRSVMYLHRFLEGVVAPERWCDWASTLAAAADALATPWGDMQREMIVRRLTTILAQLRCAQALYESEASDGAWGQKLGEQVIGPVADCLSRFDGGRWQDGAEMIRTFDKPRAPTLRGLPERTAELVKNLRSKALDQFAGLRELAVVNPDYMNLIGEAAGRQTRALIELVRRFRALYAEKKRSLGGLDFADLERYALQLLTVHEGSDGAPEPSATALALRGRYRHIFVDEYQDVNPVQQAILDALSTGDNLFGVGDIKQSIYGFRGAEPTIFLQRLMAASGAKAKTPGFRIDLNCNFRSAERILHFVNAVFARVMTAEIAHIDYDEAARLRPGLEEAGEKSSSPLVELHILDEKAQDETTDESNADNKARDSVERVDPRQRQAMMIARRIQEIVGAETGRAEFQMRDSATGALRDVEYRDIVVLMRSLAKKANEYVEVFRLAGIPVSCDATAGYFEATEISDVLCLIKVLDNPQRDIELAAVLRSPFFGLGDTDLAQIRLHGDATLRAADFHTCAADYGESGPDTKLKERISGALATLERWRNLARRGSLADLLWRIYRETHYIAFVSALPNGQARKANLLKLHDRAVQFEGFAGHAGIASLTRFVAFVERLQDVGQDWAPAQPGSAAGNAVRILSVHKSKGLEFPVVFLAEMETEFNLRDVRADLVFDVEATVGLQIVERQSNSKLSSLAHQVIGEKKRAASLAEEMRILYVATTRAKDRLILTASQTRTDCGKLLARGLLLSGRTVPDWLLTGCKSALEWILYGLADQRVLHDAFETGLSADAADDGLFDFTLHGAEELRVLSEAVVTLRDDKRKSTVPALRKGKVSADGKKLLAELKARLDRQYPFAPATHAPAKRSVTDLTHQNDEFAQLDYSRALERRPAALAATEPGRRGPDARLVGTAAHLVIASLDLSQPVTPGLIDETLGQLVSEGAMTAAVAERIDTDAIRSFFESDLGVLVLDPNHRVRREWPFTVGLPAGAAGAGGEENAAADAAADELVVVQGIIDMLVETPGGLVVIDFKTDRVAGAEIEPRAAAYRAQLELYARAAGDILGRPVAAQWLYFLSPRRAVPV